MKIEKLCDCGLSTRQISALNKKGITTPEQLCSWFPLRYIDNTTETGVSPILNEQHAVIIGKLERVDTKLSSSMRQYLSLRVIDRKTYHRVRVMLFGQTYKVYTFSQWIDEEIIVCGTLQFHHVYGYSMINPDTISDYVDYNMKVLPVWSKAAGVSEKALVKAIYTDIAEKRTDTIPEKIRDAENLCDINAMYRGLLAPKTPEDVNAACDRYLFNDLYYLASKLTVSKRETPTDGFRITTSKTADQVILSLPFSLTAGQKDAYMQVRQSMMEGKHLSALVQGDVGAGKTIVAFLAMILAAENGGQACIMAPTQILAEQHYAKLCDLIQGTDLKCALLSGPAATKEDKEGIKDGSIRLIVGTHAVLSDQIAYKKLTLLVVDEEHKFGVGQRQKLTNITKDLDVISMTATPIPRTLAKALFGDNTEVIEIKDKPAGRKPIKTFYDSGSKIVPFMKKVLDAGQQAYVVCPMIDEADSESVMHGVMSTHEAVQYYKKELGSQYTIAELTGQTSPEDTEAILRDFHDNKIQVLVSTTVVEVGVDVPNACLMVIQNAERFGLAGMHQLRGRVGRGKEQGYCILQSAQTPDENKRLAVMGQTTDGFEIAKMDMLYLRKAGDLFGNRQSGYNKYIEEMVMYPDLYKKAMEYAENQSTDDLQKHIDFIEASRIEKRHRMPARVVPTVVPDHSAVLDAFY